MPNNRKRNAEPLVRTVTDEMIISALISCGTQKEAADKLGISTRTIYERMHEPAFRCLYQAANADLLRETVREANSNLRTAMQTIAEVMNNRENNDAVRLQAAQMLLNNAAKLSERLNGCEWQASVEAQEAAKPWRVDFK